MTPTWIRVVGILGIVFAVAGFLNSVHTIALPWMFEMQTRMVTEMSSAFGRDETGDDAGRAFVEHLMEPARPWFRAWSLLAGLTGLVISGFYLHASIRLMEGRPEAVALFLGLSFAGLALALGRVLATFLGGGLFLAMSAGIYSLASAALHAAIIGVVWRNSRSPSSGVPRGSP